jgi:acid phosphatase
MRPPRLLVAPLLVAGLLLAGCGATPAPVRSNAAPLWLPSVLQRPSKVLIVVEENHTQGSALRGMPYLSALAASYGRTTTYKAVSHPSLPNYLAMAGGSTFGVRDDRSPGSHHLAGQSAFDRAIAAGRTAKTYAEAMPAPCGQSATSRYAVKHNPWAYFSDPASRANCKRFDVPAGTTSAGALRADIDGGTLPNVGLLVPDICHDGHDCSLATADSWLKSWLTTVRQGADYRAGRLAIVITFDEDDNSGNNTVLTTVVSPYTSHVASARPYSHYSLTRYMAEITGTSPLRAAATATSLRADFRI